MKSLFVGCSFGPNSIICFVLVFTSHWISRIVGHFWVIASQRNAQDEPCGQSFNWNSIHLRALAVGQREWAKHTGNSLLRYDFERKKDFFLGWMRERILVWCHIPSERHHHIASFIAYDPSTRIPNEMINIIYLIVANQRPNAWMNCVLGQRPVDIVDDLIETTHRTEW